MNLESGERETVFETNWLRNLRNIPEWWESQLKALYNEPGNPYEDSEFP